MRKVKRITDLGSILQQIFADRAASIKTAEAGLDLAPIGALGAAIRVGEGATIMVFNSTAGVEFVSFGVQAMSAPTDATDGIPILAGEKFFLSSGIQNWIRASDAGVFGFTADNLD